MKKSCRTCKYWVISSYCTAPGQIGVVVPSFTLCEKYEPIQYCPCCGQEVRNEQK